MQRSQRDSEGYAGRAAGHELCPEVPAVAADAVVTDCVVDRVVLCWEDVQGDEKDRLERRRQKRDGGENGLFLPAVGVGVGAVTG
jgi:hypothetical protein